VAKVDVVMEHQTHSKRSLQTRSVNILLSGSSFVCRDGCKWRGTSSVACSAADNGESFSMKPFTECDCICCADNELIMAWCAVERVDNVQRRANAAAVLEWGPP
jgi:hypothetical protein